jgi:zinc transport system substrate-binding protein
MMSADRMVSRIQPGRAAGVLLLSGALLVLVSCAGEKQAPGREKDATGPQRPAIAVSNSWLACSLSDLAGSTVNLVQVVPPGMCPGHFDIRPGTVKAIQNCSLFILFDFQRSIAEKIDVLSMKGMQAIYIEAPEGLSVPDSYLAGCETTLEALAGVFPENQGAYRQRFEEIRQRLHLLEQQIQQEIAAAGLENAKVVASGHQGQFCRWLGLDPVGLYSGPESTTPAQMEKLLADAKSSGVRFVVANLQEGVQAGEAFAYQLGVPLVVFSNFPSMETGQKSFDELVRFNVRNLLSAANKETEQP